MKIKLSVGKSPWSGYLNIDPAPKIDKDKEGQFNIVNDLHGVYSIEQARCTEFLVDHAIHYFPANVLVETIKMWISKLRHGGKIIINGTNLESITKAYLNGILTTLDFNMLIYKYTENLPNYASCICIDEVEDIFVKSGLKIISKQLDEFDFSIIGMRE